MFGRRRPAVGLAFLGCVVFFKSFLDFAENLQMSYHRYDVFQYLFVCLLVLDPFWLSSAVSCVWSPGVKNRLRKERVNGQAIVLEEVKSYLIDWRLGYRPDDKAYAYMLLGRKRLTWWVEMYGLSRYLYYCVM